MKAKTLIRLERLEGILQPQGEPQIIQVQFVNAQHEAVNTFDFTVDSGKAHWATERRMN